MTAGVRAAVPAEATEVMPPQAKEGSITDGARLLSLDVLRGLAIAAMILVNNPGNHAQVYWLLRHAEWNGCMPADLIFPFFLFIVGVSISFSLGARVDAGAGRQELLPRIIRRTRILFGLGLLLNALPFFDWAILRIPGILQRIALCYGITALMVLRGRRREIGWWAAGLLLLYWALMEWVPVPGYGAGVLLPERNLAAYIDRLLMGTHLGQHGWDPEGVLSTIPAIGTTLLGVIAGDWSRLHPDPSQRLRGLAFGGACAAAAGVLIGIWFPINKNLWTSSFALLSAGVAAIAFAACYWFADVRGYHRWARPFTIYGTNAILAYFLSSVLAKLMSLIEVISPTGATIMLRTAILRWVFRPFASPQAASFLFALSYTVLWLGVLTVLYRRKIFVKI